MQRLPNRSGTFRALRINDKGWVCAWSGGRWVEPGEERGRERGVSTRPGEDSGLDSACLFSSFWRAQLDSKCLLAKLTQVVATRILWAAEVDLNLQVEKEHSVYVSFVLLRKELGKNYLIRYSKA